MAEGGSMDKAIYLRVSGSVDGEDVEHWYLIEEKSVTDVGDPYEAVFKTEEDMVGHFLFPHLQPFVFSSSLVIVESDIYLNGWNGIIKPFYCRPDEYKEEDGDERIAYQVLTRDDQLSWQPRGTLTRHQGGGAAVGPDGNIYTMGDGIYRFSPDGSFHDCTFDVLNCAAGNCAA